MSSGRHGGSTGQPGGIPYDLQAVRHSQDLDMGGMATCESQPGCRGIDGETIERFENKLGDNLYKLWNRMTSGSYFPPPVKAVPIPKKSGGVRILGIPTVTDRIAQTAPRNPALCMRRDGDCLVRGASRLLP